jgi:hypothetical protein
MLGVALPTLVAAPPHPASIIAPSSAIPRITRLFPNIGVSSQRCGPGLRKKPYNLIPELLEKA